MPALKEALSQLAVSKVEVVSDRAEDRTANLEALYLEKGFISLSNPPQSASVPENTICDCSCWSLCECSTHCIIAE